MAWAAVRSKAVILLLLIIVLCIPHCFWGSVLVFVLVCIAYVSSFAIIMTRKRELVALFFLCLVTVTLQCFVALPRRAVGWSAVCDCGIF